MYQKGQYSKAFTKSGSTLKSSQKWLSQQIVNSFINSLTALTAKYKSAKVRKAPVIFQNVLNTNTICATIQNQSRQTKHKEMECSKSLDHFVFRTKKGQLELFLTTKRQRDWTVHSKDKHTMHLMGTGAGLVT